MSARSEGVHNSKFMCHKKEQKQCKNSCKDLKLTFGHSAVRILSMFELKPLCWEHNMAVENAANTINQNMSLYLFTHETS